MTGCLDINKNIFIVTASLKPSAGGRTKSLIQRANLLADYYGCKVNICSISYNPDLDKDISEFYIKERFHENIILHNLYDDLMHDNILKEEKCHNTHDEGLFVHVTGENRYLHFENGEKSYLKDFDKVTNKLHHVNIYSKFNGSLLKREHYDLRGYLHKADFFNENSGKIWQRIHYDKSGVSYLTVLYRLQHNEVKLTNIIYQGISVSKFNFHNINELYTEWLTSKISGDTAFIVDARIMDESVLNIKDSRAYKILQLHNNYHKDPMDLSSPFKARAKTLVDRGNEADFVVSLTQSQMEDLIENANLDKSRATFIPHSIEKKDIIYSKIKLNIVIVARLAKQKRIDHAIRAFKIFSSSYPEFSLHIYGDGEEKENIDKLIKDMGLERKCFLKGYTEDVQRVFQEAYFSLVSSNFEGFPLSILESLSNGCPVVSYDINFGPKDMIINGTNGYLAELGNVDDLAAKMECAINSDFINQPLQVQDTISYLNKINFVESWGKIINV